MRIDGLLHRHARLPHTSDSTKSYRSAMAESPFMKRHALENLYRNASVLVDFRMKARWVLVLVRNSNASP